jgi:hypothetical protein
MHSITSQSKMPTHRGQQSENGVIGSERFALNRDGIDERVVQQYGKKLKGKTQAARRMKAVRRIELDSYRGKRVHHANFLS